mgnify:FL=1
MNVTEKSSFLENMNKMYEDREAIFEKREQEYQKQKKTLSVMLGQIQQEKDRLLQQAKEQESLQKELNEKQEMLQGWYDEEVQTRKTLEANKKEYEEEKEHFLVQSRMELELAKNEKIKAQQVKEAFEHQLSVVELLLNQQGEDGTKVIEFFHSFMEGQSTKETDEMGSENERLKSENLQLQEQNAGLAKQLEHLQEEKEMLEEENEELADTTAHFEQERKKLLGLIAKLQRSGQKKEVQATKEPSKEVPGETINSVDWEEPVWESVEVKREDQDNMAEEMAAQMKEQEVVYEELTATVLQSYLQKNERRCEQMEIRHSEDCEQLHFTMNGLNYAFLFSSPAAFEVSAPRKNGRVLQKVLAKMNEKYSDVKFQYEDGSVYAIGYFMNTIRPERLMERVHVISDCFKQ